MFNSYTPWKRHKTFGFMTFLGDIEMKHWVKMFYIRRTAVIMMALSRKPNPTKGTKLQKPTKWKQIIILKNDWLL